jgi:membrane-bound lytic murein transglycosylase D
MNVLITILLLALTLASGPAFATDSIIGDVSTVTNPADTDGVGIAMQRGLRLSPVRVLELPVHQPRVLKLDLTRDANDIWDRIQRGFAMPDLDSERVVDRQAFYLNRPGFLKQVFERGAPYLYHIVDELERRGLPTELALLPMIESNYNPLALSPSKAAGLWQFIPSTGRNFNLTQDKWVDERRDVVASTNAALDYLEYLYDMHGDWHLALASYNWGEGSVGRAIRRNREEGKPAEYTHLQMPEETRNYIPKLQALKNIVAQPELFDLELPHIPNHRHFISVAAPKGLDLATAAHMADMPIAEFIALNPGYNRPVIALSGQSLAVPVDRVGPFKSRLDEIGMSGKRWKTYQLKRDEDLAAVAKRFGLSLAQLHQVNGLNSRSRLGAGFTVLVPDGVDPAGALEAARAMRNR